jgi:glucoamylase
MDKGVERRDITRPAHPKNASGKPGSRPHWNSGAKTIVGSAVSGGSRIWYTVNSGTVGEIYFPDVDQANTRAVRFVVSDETGFFCDVMGDALHKVRWAEVGAPACRIKSRCKSGCFCLTQEIVPNPLRDTLLLRGRFKPADGKDLRLYLIIDAQVGDRGEMNTAWAGDYKGHPMVFAQRGPLVLACFAAPAALKASVGYVGKSDGLTMLRHHKPLPDANLALKGNVTMTMEVNYRSSSDGSFVVALAGGTTSAEAAQQARASALQDFDKTFAIFLDQWRAKQGSFLDVADLSGHELDMYRVSTAVLETHQSKRFPGGFVASLSLPWGFDRSDTDVGGYHVVWPRDTVETAMGKLACGDVHSARSTLAYLRCTQDSDGHWSQNMWLDGTPHANAIQMDATALPILLADRLRREDALEDIDVNDLVYRATCFLLRHGPVTQQDRWETTPGYSPYTMAIEVAALLAAADFADESGFRNRTDFLRETADAWNDAIDELTYVEGTALAKKHQVRGYYVRMTPPRRIETQETGGLRIRVPNVPSGPRQRKAVEILSPGALALVRFGLRAPNDPRIIDTVKLIDATLRSDTATGPAWKRSTEDGYGEKADGRPFDKTGVGHGWPLLAGERGHFELAAGRRDAALALLKTMARQTSECGMIPEQVWDAPSLPGRALFNGKPTGSGMPLVWAHSEYIKLLRSLHIGEVWDRMSQTEERYLYKHLVASFQIWTPQQRRGWLMSGKDLRLDLPTHSHIRWTVEGKTARSETIDSGFGLHCAMLETRVLLPGVIIEIDVRPKDARKHGSPGPDRFVVKVRA